MCTENITDIFIYKWNPDFNQALILLHFLFLLADGNVQGKLKGALLWSGIFFSLLEGLEKGMAAYAYAYTWV